MKKLFKKKFSKKAKKRLIILGAILGFLIVFLIAAVEVTSHSGFCASCHYMKPFFKSWEESSHKDFECSVCHYPPGGGIKSKLTKKIEGLVMLGRYWTKLYVKSKPWAEVKDESCLRGGCHEKRLLEGQVPFNNVTFDHKVHFSDLKRGKLLQCTSCHSQIVQGEHITVTESSCFICHFKESEFYPRIADCMHCHRRENLIKEDTSRYNHSPVFDNGFTCDQCHSNTILGDGDVPRENCYKCHWETDRLEKYEDTDLMHTMHIASNKIECNQCHSEIQHKIVKDIKTIADCETCHTDYHKAQIDLFIGEGGKGIPHSVPNVMLNKGLSCKGCHIFHEKKEKGELESDTFVSDEKACETCHGSGFARILKDWEISTSKKLSEIKTILSRARGEIRRSRKAEKAKAESLLEESYFNIELVELGKSVHNMEFSQELLSVSYSKIKEALSVIGSSYKPAKFSGTSEEIPTQCSNCHMGIEEINKEVFGLNFPHKSHLIEQKIHCDTCHSNVRKHGEFVATKQSCAVCHHRDLPKDKDCSLCHTLQNTVYKGGNLKGFSFPKDVMSEAEVECSDCHRNPQNRIFRSDAKTCAGCHDEDYEALFSEWQSSVKDLIKELKATINENRKLKLTEEQKNKVREAESFLINIELDGSSGIHNYMFIEETLTSLKRAIESYSTGQALNKN